MLQAMRGRGATWVARILFFLLALSFFGWGIADYLRPVAPGAQTVLTVGEHALNGIELQRALGPQIDRLRGLFGGIDRDQAKRFGVIDQALEQFIARLLLEQEAARLGLLVSDDVLRQAIQKNPAFAGSGGQFDRTRFATVLAQAGYTEANFLAHLRADLPRAALTQAIATGARVPDEMVDRILAYRLEKRTADYLYLSPESAPAPAEPSVETLMAFHTENPALFTAPERRSGKLLLLDASDLAAGIRVADKELREAFDARQDEFLQPERRKIEQVLLKDENSARVAAEKIARGADFSALAAEMGSSANKVFLGEFSKAELLDKALADAAFALAKPGITDPIETSFGWHLLHVVSITPAVAPAFETVKPVLEASLRQEHGQDLVFEHSQKLEDMLAAGHSLEDAAAAVGARPIEFAPVDQRGFTASGTPGIGETLPGRSQILTNLFTLNAGKTSGLIELEGRSFAALQIGEVIPTAVQAFDTVQKTVRTAWLAAQKDKFLADRAEALTNAARSGKSLASLAPNVQSSAPFDRRGQISAGLPPAPGVLTGLFDAPALGAIVSGKAGTGYLVACLTAILPPEAEEAQRKRAELKAEILQQAQSDLIAALRQGLQTRYKVEFDRAAIDVLF